MLGPMYAAPFLLVAAIVFSVFAAIPRTRRLAIIAPTGVIVFGPASIIGYLIEGLIRSKIWGHDFPADQWDYVAYAVSGLIAAAAAILIVRLVLQFLPALILRLVVLSGAFFSYFVLICAAFVGMRIYLGGHSGTQHNAISGMVLLCVFVLLSALGAWFTSFMQINSEAERWPAIHRGQLENSLDLCVKKS